MEGYYWRMWDAASGRALVALCGICRARDGVWAVVALAAHPGGFVRWVNAARAVADPDGLGAAAWDQEGTALLRGSGRRIAVDLGADARLEATLEGRAEWPRRGLGALGPAQAAPGLPQYWHPHLLGARVRGEARMGAETVELSGFEAYAEKNWGPRFPGDWWWGQAGFGTGALTAFAGGPVAGRLAATAAVVRAGRDVLAFAPPLAFVSATTGTGEWRVRARTARHTLTLEGEAAGTPQLLPVPVVAERRAVLRSEHHLAGRLRCELRRGPRVLVREESRVAGLERGVPS